MRAGAEAQGDGGQSDDCEIFHGVLVFPPFSASGQWARTMGDGPGMTTEIFAENFHPQISTGVPTGTRSKRSITHALPIRTQPKLAGVPSCDSALVPWM